MTTHSLTTPWGAPKGMDEYLKQTRMVDSESPVVTETAARLLEGAKTPTEAAQRFFLFVRDDIKYARINLYSKASEVIQLRLGNCTNKSVVFVALARAANIPARLHYLSIRKETVSVLIHPIIRPLIPDVVDLNARTDIFLDGTWLMVETELDPELYQGLVKKELIEPIDISWDGKHSTHWFDQGNVEDLDVYSCPEKVVDSFMYRQLNWPKRLTYPISAWLSNRYIESHRKVARS